MIYAIGDLHFDYTEAKPMGIFGENWLNHEEKIIDNWNEMVREDDLVLLPGDISWALKLNDAVGDLERIHRLPGKKIILKGNHDYWWSSLSKLNSLNLDSLVFLQNNGYVFRQMGVSGTRGWISRDTEGFDENDEKVFLRELARLRLSLESIKACERKIVMLHYPPFNMDLTPNEFIHLMKKYEVNTCIYGHLHSDGHKYAVEGKIEGVDFYCVSSDYIDFKPKLIWP